jgi:hypothetical protein
MSTEPPDYSLLILSEKKRKATGALVDNLADNPAHKGVYKKNRGIINESEQEDTGIVPGRTLDIQDVDNIIYQKKVYPRNSQSMKR